MKKIIRVYLPTLHQPNSIKAHEFLLHLFYSAISTSFIPGSCCHQDLAIFTLYTIDVHLHVHNLRRGRFVRYHGDACNWCFLSEIKRYDLLVLLDSVTLNEENHWCVEVSCFNNIIWTMFMQIWDKIALNLNKGINLVPRCSEKSRGLMLHKTDIQWGRLNLTSQFLVANLIAL